MEYYTSMYLNSALQVNVVEVPRLPSTCVRYFVCFFLGIATNLKVECKPEPALCLVATPNLTKYLVQLDGNRGMCELTWHP